MREPRLTFAGNIFWNILGGCENGLLMEGPFKPQVMLVHCQDKQIRAPVYPWSTHLLCERFWLPFLNPGEGGGGAVMELKIFT